MVLDGTYNAVRFLGKAKVSEDCVMSAIGWFDALCAEADCTIISLWHPSQAGQERGDASGWSVAWHNRPRARLSLTPKRDIKDAVTLKVEKRNHGPKAEPVTLYWSGGALLPRADVGAREQQERFEAACIAAAVTAAQSTPIQTQRNLPDWVFEDVERAAGFRPTKRQVKEALAQAVRDGRLQYRSHVPRKHPAGYCLAPRK
jgi:RecA-family ATPase